MCSTYYASQQELMQHLHQRHSKYFTRHIRYSSEFRRPYNQVNQDIQLQNTRPAPQAKRNFRVCGLCDKVTKQKAQFYKHMREDHPQYVRENWFHCSYCQSAFPDKWTLNAHLHHCCTLSPVFDDVDLDATDFQLHWLPTKMIATKTLYVSSFGIPDS